MKTITTFGFCGKVTQTVLHHVKVVLTKVVLQVHLCCRTFRVDREGVAHVQDIHFLASSIRAKER
eukprot:6101429-Amphidinium_carterae.1